MSSCVLCLLTRTGNPGQEPHSNVLGFWTVRTNSKENRLEEKSDPQDQLGSEIPGFIFFLLAERLSSKLQTGIRGRQKRSQERPFLLSLEMPHRQSIKFRLVLPPNLFPKQVPGLLVLSYTRCCSLKQRKHSAARNWWRCENQLLPSWRQGQLLEVLTECSNPEYGQRGVSWSTEWGQSLSNPSPQMHEGVSTGWLQAQIPHSSAVSLRSFAKALKVVEIPESKHRRRVRLVNWGYIDCLHSKPESAFSDLKRIAIS